jgi:hypothetical protein
MIIDSGTSYLLMPTEDYVQLTNMIATISPCIIDPLQNGLITCLCTNIVWPNYPPLKLTVDGTTIYTLTKANYFTRRGQSCTLRIMSMPFPATPLESRFWVMGLNFFHNYYAIFDPTLQRVGFTESKLST